MKISSLLANKQTRVVAGIVLLSLLLIQLFVINILPNHWHSTSHEVCLSSIVFVIGLTLEKGKKILFPLLVVLISLLFISQYFNLDKFYNILLLFRILLLFTIIGIYILQTSREQRVNASVILQSINGYLLLGVISSLIIIIILRYYDNAFSFPDAYVDTDIGLVIAQYIGLVTITTLGYGDIVPMVPIAHSATTFIAVSGQLYIAIIIALLVGKFSSSKSIP